VPALRSFDYAVIRVVPRVEREEFINAGVILYCSTLRLLAAAVELDVSRLLALAPDVDVEIVRSHLASIPRICAGGHDAGPIGALSPVERFDWLVAPRSTVIQTSPVHAGLCANPQDALEQLIERMVRQPRR
jgi:hypothetical protein